MPGADIDSTGVEAPPSPLPVQPSPGGLLVNTKYQPGGQLVCTISLVSGPPEEEGDLIQRINSESSAILITKRAQVLGDPFEVSGYTK